jgi:hypothetical protein
VRNCGIEIVCHAIDLAQSPASLIAQVRRIAAEIAVH